MGVPQKWLIQDYILILIYDFRNYDYTLLNIFEGWMDYISSGAEREVADFQTILSKNGISDHISDTMFITKFEKNMKEN